MTTSCFQSEGKTPLFFAPAQKRGTDEGVNQIRDQRSEANVRHEMADHVDPVIAIDQDKHAKQIVSIHPNLATNGLLWYTCSTLSIPIRVRGEQ